MSAAELNTAARAGGSVSLSADRLTPQLLILGPTLSLWFHPHSLHLMAAVSRRVHQWTAEQLPLLHRHETRRWQGRREALADTKRAMDAARSALSAEEATRLDAAVVHAWHLFSTGDDVPPPHCRGSLAPLPVARSLAAEMCDLLWRGAVLSFDEFLPWPQQNTCGFCRHYVMGAYGMGYIWEPDASDEWVSIFGSLLTLAWTSNPRLLGDQTYLSGGVHRNLVHLLFEPVLSRFSGEDTWTFCIDQRRKADLIHTLTSTIVLLLQINEANDIDRRCLTGCYPYSYSGLLYEDAAEYLIPQVDWCWRFDVRERRTRNKYLPLDDEHRYQQQSLCHLLLNHYHTAVHGLAVPSTVDSTSSSSSSSSSITEQRRRNLDMIRMHVRSDAAVPRADLGRIWAHVREATHLEAEL